MLLFYSHDANVCRCNPFLGAFENYFQKICKKLHEEKDYRANRTENGRKPILL